jgi:hypothetical protein
MFGFPFETITTAANRAAVMDRVLEFFGVAPILSGDFDGNGFVDGADFLIWQRGFTAENPIYSGADFLAWQRGFSQSNATPAGVESDQNSVVDFVSAISASSFGSVIPATPASTSNAVAAMAATLEAAEESAAPTSQTTSGTNLGWLAQRAAWKSGDVFTRSTRDVERRQLQHDSPNASSPQAGVVGISLQRKLASAATADVHATAFAASIDLAFEDRSLKTGSWKMPE